MSASAPGNAITGALTTLPGSNIHIGSSHAPAGLTVASAFVVNGFLGLQTLPSDPGVATLTIADGGTVTVQGGPDLNGLTQGTLEGAGRLVGGW